MAGYKPYGYQYETSPRKLQPEYEPNKNPYKKKKSTLSKKSKSKFNKAKQKEKQKVQVNKPKKQTKYNYKPVVYIGLAFAMLFTISYRYSLINERYNEKESIKSQVSAVEKQNEQLKVSIENSLNLTSIEQAAKDQLGMQKLKKKKKVYLDLQKRDYVQPASEEVVIDDSQTWFDKIMEKLTQVIK